LNKQYIKRSGFTLIELLTVIAIIGILAAILIPAVGKVRDVANKTISSSNMRSIAVVHATFSSLSGRTRVITPDRLANAGFSAEKSNSVALFLAQETNLLDAAFWRIDTDPAVITATTAPPPSVAYNDATNGFTPTAGFEASPVSYDFFVGVGGNDEPANTPLLTTHGLTTDGTWPSATTPWGGGGHIAFLDAHVTWYNKLDATELGLVNLTDGTLTTKYTEAVRGNGEVTLYEAMR
jgi:prepilin-type N-terminal cleavage/methylation domain-containing protein/prepilin-type processing-associated H-X9-DG protein